MPVTMHDVAARAGVSIATVSRVLSGKDSAIAIGAQTRERVLQVCRELGYRPNLLARGLSTNRSRLLGVILRDVGDPFHSLVVRGIDAEVRAAGYHYLLSHTSSAEGIAECAQICSAYHADGMIVVGDMAGDEAILADVFAAFPCTVLTGHPPFASARRVIVDNHGGMRAVLEHLHGLGHRRVAYVYCPQIWDMRERLDTVRAFAAGRGLELDWVVETDNTFAGGARALRTLWSAERRPTALAVASDVMAVGALHAAYELGLRVPQDLSISGFDGIEFARFTTPEITTVSQPMYELGRTLAHLLIRWLEEGAVPPAETVLPTALVVRGSTAAISV